MDDQLLEKSYWQSIFDNALTWIMEQGPGLFLTIVLFVVLFQLVKFLLRRVERIILKRVAKTDVNHESEKRAKTLMGILRDALNIAVWIIFIMIILKDIGIDIAPLLAGAGILGLAIGFGAQELVKDVISGFFMLLENQVRAGDVVAINGVGGVVERIELRTLTLRDMQGTVHIFQNGKIDTLSNMTKEWSAAVFDLEISYDSDLQKAIKVIEEVGSGLNSDNDFKDKIIDNTEIFGLDSFKESAISIKVRIKTKPAEQWGVAREFNQRIKAAFDGAGIEIPYPHRVVKQID